MSNYLVVSVDWPHRGWNIGEEAEENWGTEPTEKRGQERVLGS